MTLSPLFLAVGKFNLSGSVIAAVKVAAHFADTLGEPRTQPEAVDSCAISNFPQDTPRTT